MQRRVNTISLTLLTLLLIKPPAQAQPSLFPNTKQQRRVTVTWQEQELATAIHRLANATQSTIWLDRRVDRQQAVTIQLNDLSLDQALERLARQQSLGLTQLGNVFYIGPQQTTDYLPTLIKQAHKSLERLPSKAKRRWLEIDSTSWPHLSEPRTLATQWAQEASGTLVGSEQIPHDLWRKKSLPPMPRVDRLVLLLAGFDLTCHFTPDGKTCQIVPINYPTARVSKKTSSRTKSTAPRKSKSRQLFTLSLENQQVGRILDQFSKQLSLEIVWPNNAKASKSLRERRISCDVKNVDLDKLLQSVLAPAGLQHQQDGKKIIIQEATPQ